MNKLLGAMMLGLGLGLGACEARGTQGSEGSQTKEGLAREACENNEAALLQEPPSPARDAALEAERRRCNSAIVAAYEADRRRTQ